MLYQCCDEDRRAAVRARRTLKSIDFNGIDYLDVSGNILDIHFIHPLVSERVKQPQRDALSKERISITGGERISDVVVKSVTMGKRTDVLKIEVNKAGDYSTYTLHLKPNPRLLVLDPLLKDVDFTFSSINTIDCETEQSCLPELPSTPEIDYLARDFASFRQLMLDRLSLLMPQWRERSAADLGVMLVEILAYVGDHLSYQQDVIATESYLSTARRRISVRRHARLLDYFISEGCNARVWVQIQVDQNIARQPGDKTSPLPKGTQLITEIAGQKNGPLSKDSSPYKQALTPALSTQTPPEVFETMYDVDALFIEHNQMSFYTWGAKNCCLPKGTTHATLKGHFTHLQPGDVLIFTEMVGAHTGVDADADPTHRCAVRLTNVTLTQDPIGGWYTQHHPPQSKGKQSEGRVVEEMSITETDVLDEDITVERKGRSEHEEHAVIKETKVITEKRITQDGVVIEDRFEEKEPQIEEVREDTQDTSIHPTHMQHEHEAQRDEHAKPDEKHEHKHEGHEKHEHEGQEKHEHEHAKPEGKHEHEHDREKNKGEVEEEAAEGVKEVLHTTSGTSEEHAGEKVEEQDTTDITIERTIQVEEKEKKGKVSTEVHVVTETRTIEEKDIRREIEPDYAVDITEIEWHYEDALSFPLCISATTDYEHKHTYREDVSIAFGNIVLADHGQTKYETLPAVPMSSLSLPATNGNRCEEKQPVSLPVRFYPSLKYTPLTCKSVYDEHNPPISASAIMQQSAHNAMPAIELSVLTPDEPISKVWIPQRDLLNSKPTDRHFVAESESDGITYLRFGDDQQGLRPAGETTFYAKYRIGNGVSGNIGSEALYHIVSDDARISSIGNPLPAVGGTEPESIEDVRQKITRAFTTQGRGVTPQDYKEIAEGHSEVHKANAIMRWTGSWYTVFLVVERTNGMPVDDTFKQTIRKYMEQSRMAGADLVVVSPVYVSLEIVMTVIVKTDYFRGNVKASLLEVFSNRQWPDGQRGIFYPDSYTFGQPIYLNTLLAAALGVVGVASVDVNTFQRQGFPASGLQDGVLTMDWREIVRLDNNPNAPEHGIFSLTVEDGK